MLFEDVLQNKIDSVRGGLNGDLAKKVADLSILRMDLANLLNTGLMKSPLVRTTHVRSDSNFPVVYFDVSSDYSGNRQIGSSSLTVKTDGTLDINISAPSTSRDIIQKHLQIIYDNPQIKSKIQEIKKLSVEISRLLEGVL